MVVKVIFHSSNDETDDAKIIGQTPRGGKQLLNLVSDLSGGENNRLFNNGGAASLGHNGYIEVYPREDVKDVILGKK